MTRLGLGCMRLSSVGGPTRAEAIAVIHLALDSGVRLLDTADVYGPSARDIGHNERLVGEALDQWAGDRGEVTVVSKGGLTRRGAGRWLADGRAKHLTAACEASAQRLGAPIDLYLLHALDPQRELSTSVRALAKLQDRGLVRRVGVSNVRLDQLREAREHAEISAVEVGLWPLDRGAIRTGVVGYCADEGIQLIAHSPFGGPKRTRGLARHPVLATLADQRGVSVHALVLAWLLSLSDNLWPIPGPTRLETARDLGVARELELTQDERARLEAAFPAARILTTPIAARRPPDHADGEVVLIMGMPASGKTTQVRDFVDRGYLRLNRDDAGGNLADLAPILDQSLASGRRRVVLDNTYPRRSSRNLMIETAWAHGVPVRCVWIDTSLEDAQVNACQRMLERHGQVLGPEEMKRANRSDPNSFPPRAQLHFRAVFEAPTLDEGFVAVDVRPFVRRAASGQARAVFVDPGQLEAAHEGPLADHIAQGYLVLGIGWRPEGAPGPDSVWLGDIEIPTLWCTHPPGPIGCWCRKPLPGLAVALVEAHGLDPVACRVWGRGAAERGLAERLGARFEPLESVFAGSVSTVEL
ncbi:putative oxidoreductase YdbC [Enhygromyxa salina]|uniref:Putative oxidoreductase YdbC n=1 Tax=Enhygromyxa salina TaxID=215803 RepID=A0A2S9XEJ0_9BACT|nr:aldo/keto reductase [Enhygromyxa salina]PRP91284.1 putative oxidoreductase YdbC [Enhygromyxa salina]